MHFTDVEQAFFLVQRNRQVRRRILASGSLDKPRRHTLRLQEMDWVQKIFVFENVALAAGTIVAINIVVLASCSVNICVCVFVCQQKSWDSVSSLVVLVSIIQSRSLLLFNGPRANVLSGQQGPRAQRHFNGCHDERVKLEHGDPVSSKDKKKKKKKGGQSRRQERGTGVRSSGIRWRPLGRGQMVLLDWYVWRKVM